MFSARAVCPTLARLALPGLFSRLSDRGRLLDAVGSSLCLLFDVASSTLQRLSSIPFPSTALSAKLAKRPKYEQDAIDQSPQPAKPKKESKCQLQQTDNNDRSVTNKDSQTRCSDTLKAVKNRVVVHTGGGAYDQDMSVRIKVVHPGS